jgi:hypothetical protein
VVAPAAIVHSPDPYNAWSVPDNFQNCCYRDNAFRSLMQAVDGGTDAAPSPHARPGYTKTRGLLDASLRKWMR